MTKGCSRIGPGFTGRPSRGSASTLTASHALAYPSQASSEQAGFSGVGMHINKVSSHVPGDVPGDGSDAAEVVLRIARKLHRAAASPSLATALPVLRRVIASNTLHGLSLPELYRRRDMVQRKHILRTLATEAGFNSWEAYRSVLDHLRADQLEHFDVVGRQAGYPNLWFSTSAEAQAHARKYGGRLVRVGEQAVVFADMEPSGKPFDSLSQT